MTLWKLIDCFSYIDIILLLATGSRKTLLPERLSLRLSHIYYPFINFESNFVNLIFANLIFATVIFVLKVGYKYVWCYCGYSSVQICVNSEFYGFSKNFLKISWKFSKSQSLPPSNVKNSTIVFAQKCPKTRIKSFEATFDFSKI